jgi:hypothetical protein
VPANLEFHPCAHCTHLVIMVYNSSLLFAGLLSLVSSLAVNNIPVATPISNHRALLGLSPTPAPSAEELRRRQATQVTEQTLLAAPDNTCGYFDGNSGSCCPNLRTLEFQWLTRPKSFPMGLCFWETVSLQLQQQHRTAPSPFQVTCCAVTPKLAAQHNQLRRHVGIGGEPISYFRLSHDSSPKTTCPLPKHLNRAATDSPVT